MGILRALMSFKLITFTPYDFFIPALFSKLIINLSMASSFLIKVIISFVFLPPIDAFVMPSVFSFSMLSSTNVSAKSSCDKPA